MRNKLNRLLQWLEATDRLDQFQELIVDLR
jgi:hypothetical protein